MIVVWLSSLLVLQFPVLLDRYSCVGNSNGNLFSLPQCLWWLCNRPIVIEKVAFSGVFNCLFFVFFLRI